MEGKKVCKDREYEDCYGKLSLPTLPGLNKTSLALAVMHNRTVNRHCLESARFDCDFWSRLWRWMKR